MAEVKLDYEPRPFFLPFHQRQQRFACIVAHRRAGKTVACINELVIRALYTPKKNARYAYVAPYYRQAKDVAWQYLKDATKDFASDVRESELRVKLPNNAWITLYGADNPDSMRGIYLDGVVVDEIADCRPSLWGEVLLPTLADRRGWAAFIGTVKGKNHFYKLYENAKVDESWFDLMLLPKNTLVLQEDDLREMQNQMDEAEYAQEFLCDFTAAVKGTYYADQIQKMEANGNIRPQPLLFDPNQQVQCAADLGYTDSTALWFWQERPDGLAIIDYEEDHGKPLEHYVNLINDKPYTIEKLWLPHDARAKTLQTGKSTIEQLVNAGLPCAIVPQLKVQQGIDAARLVLPDCQFDLTSTAGGVEALRSYRREYNELTKSFRDTPLHDWASDGADAFRYLALVSNRKRGKLPEKPIESVIKPPEYTLDKLYADRDRSQTLSFSRRRI